MSPSTSTTATSGVPTFASLGVEPLINCMGTYTRISGSLVLRQAAEAMMEATNHYVDMDELMDKVGQRLAALTGAEWGYVASSCTAAVAALAAACIAGTDPEKMARLPDATGMKNEVIIQKGHRNPYDSPMRLAGARMIEVVSLAELHAANCGQTAMIAIVGDLEANSTIPVERMIAIGRSQGVPCIVDAGASRPDVPNRYLSMGADAVAYSGGKCLRGPQASGLVLGRKDLLWAAFLNGAPHHAMGRPMKAGKEEILGLLAAVEAWVVGRDHEAEWRMWEDSLARIRSAVDDIPSVHTEIVQPGVANVTPNLIVSWDEKALGFGVPEIHKKLLDGPPRIAALPTNRGIRIVPYMMEKGEDLLVAARLRELLLDRPTSAGGRIEEASPVDMRGVWLVRIKYLLGDSKHSLDLEQEGRDLTGTYVSSFSKQSIEGTVTGNKVQFKAVLGYQGTMTRYTFDGALQEDTITGSVNLGEFGTATWTATRAL